MAIASGKSKVRDVSQASSKSSSAGHATSVVAASKWRTAVRTAAAVLVLIIAIVVMYPIRESPWANNANASPLSEAFSEPPSVSASREPKRPSDDTHDDDAYARYGVTARAKGWSHADPLEKLKSSARLFETQFDVLETQKTKEIINMILQEFDYIISRVLLSSKGRSFDLTNLLFDLIDGAQRVQFRAIKARLQASAPSSSSYPSFPRPIAAVSRAAIDADPLISKYMFAPLQMVWAASTSKDSNIKIRWCDRGGRMQLTPLSLSIRYRQYSIIPILFNATGYCDISRSLMEAVYNGDAIAADILISSVLRSPEAGSYLNMGFISVLDQARGEAEVLGFAATAAYIGSVIEFMNSGQSSVLHPRENDGAPSQPCESGSRFTIDYFSSLASANAAPAIAIPCPSQQEPQRVRATAVAQDMRRRCAIPVYQLLGSRNNSCSMGVPCMKAAEFADRFVAKNQPVALRGVVNITDWQQQWSPDALASHSGGAQAQVGKVPYEELFYADKTGTIRKSSISSYISDMFEHSSFSTTMSDFLSHADSLGNNEGLQNLSFFIDGRGSVLVQRGHIETAESISKIPFPSYVFDNKILNPRFGASSSVGKSSTLHSLSKFFGFSSSKEAITDTILLENAIRKVMAPKGSSAGAADEPVTAQLYVGPPFSGAPFHFHGPAFNALIFGRKLWYLTPPGRDVYSNAHPLEWGDLADRVEGWGAGVPYACSFIQEEGDVVFVPRHWSHQVLNLEASIGFAIEVHDYK